MVNKGGAGFKSFKATLEVFEIKLWWRLRANESLWTQLIHQ